MAHYTISNLKSALTAGGARPNMFQAKIDIPSSGKAWGIFDKEDQKTLNANKFLCKSTNLIHYFGSKGGTKMKFILF